MEGARARPSPSRPVAVDYATKMGGSIVRELSQAAGRDDEYKASQPVALPLPDFTAAGSSPVRRSDLPEPQLFPDSGMGAPRGRQTGQKAGGGRGRSTGSTVRHKPAQQGHSRTSSE